jgi:hypothetical protein
MCWTKSPGWQGPAATISRAEVGLATPSSFFNDRNFNTGLFDMLVLCWNMLYLVREEQNVCHKPNRRFLPFFFLFFFRLRHGVWMLKQSTQPWPDKEYSLMYAAMPDILHLAERLSSGSSTAATCQDSTSPVCPSIRLNSAPDAMVSRQRQGE